MLPINQIDRNQVDNLRTGQTFRQKRYRLEYHHSPTKDLFFCSNLAETSSNALRELPNTRVHCEYASTRISGSHVVIQDAADMSWAHLV